MARALTSAAARGLSGKVEAGLTSTQQVGDQKTLRPMISAQDSLRQGGEPAGASAHDVAAPCDQEAKARDKGIAEGEDDWMRTRRLLVKPIAGTSSAGVR